MTRRIAALAITACFAVVVTPATARHQKKTTNQIIFDQHGVGAENHVAGVRVNQKAGFPQRRAASAGASRDCLHHSARVVLDKLESRFGKVRLVSTCRPGARMPNGDVSWHARNRAFDFKIGRSVDKRDVMVWLGRNSPGVTMSYRSMDHIHTDTGSFHKVIYNAASHEAGARAVAIWQARAAQVQVATLEPTRSKPRQQPKQKPDVPPAEWSAVASLVAVDPTNDEFAVQPDPVRPEPIGDNDRRSIFRRYAASREIIAKPWVTTSCPNGRELPNGLLALLKDSASHYGRTVYVNSAYRSPEYNRRIRGAARNSQHIKCRAVDFRVAGISSSDVRRWVAANLNRWGITGLGYYGPSGHLHADVRPLTKATRIVTWTGGHKRYAKRRHQRYAAAG